MNQTCFSDVSICLPSLLPPCGNIVDKVSLQFEITGNGSGLSLCFSLRKDIQCKWEWGPSNQITSGVSNLI